MADHFHALATGQRIEDYEIRYVLGEGGFGLTYLAHDMKLDKSVAIKEYLPADLAVRKGDNSVIPKSSGSESDFTWGLERFLDEARMLARFDHKNIVRVHRFFQAHGTAYIVMEYVDGETLSSLLQREQTLSCQNLLSILNPLLSGLEIVHKGDILHRDIKPGNIIIRDSVVPVLIDFGAARQAVGARSRSVTAIVTPGYAPIEQYSTRGRQGPWTDIYALGAICYRAMTGETPIDAIERVRRDPLVPLSKQPIPEGYPGSFLSAVDRALSVDEEERPRSIGEWRDMFEGRVEAGAISAPTADERVKTRSLPRDSRPTASTGQSQAPSGFKPSKELVFGGIGAMAVTGLVITLISFGGRGPTPEPDPPNIAEQTIITPELAAAWTRAQTLNTAEAYEGFLSIWADSPYADDAKAAMGRLGTKADDGAEGSAKVPETNNKTFQRDLKTLSSQEISDIYDTININPDYGPNRQFESDIHNLPKHVFVHRYGQETYDQVRGTRAAREYFTSPYNDLINKTKPRPGTRAFGDVSRSFFKGLTGIAGGALAAGTYTQPNNVAAPIARKAISQGTSAIREFISKGDSNRAKERRAIARRQLNIDLADNALDYNNSNKDFTAKLEKYGKDFLTTVSNAGDNPQLIEDFIAEGIGSFALPIGATIAAGRVGTQIAARTTQALTKKELLHKN